MAVSARKMMSNEARIIKLYESSLEEYLKSYIILRISIEKRA